MADSQNIERDLENGIFTQNGIEWNYPTFGENASLDERIHCYEAHTSAIAWLSVKCMEEKFDPLMHYFCCLYDYLEEMVPLSWFVDYVSPQEWAELTYEQKFRLAVARNRVKKLCLVYCYEGYYDNLIEKYHDITTGISCRAFATRLFHHVMERDTPPHEKFIFSLGHNNKVDDQTIYCSLYYKGDMSESIRSEIESDTDLSDNESDINPLN